MRDWKLGECCEHGSLGSKCLICELTDERDELRRAHDKTLQTNHIMGGNLRAQIEELKAERDELIKKRDASPRSGEVTGIDLEELTALNDAGTPGEWEVWKGLGGWTLGPADPVLNVNDDSFTRREDFELACAAHNALPSILQILKDRQDAAGELMVDLPEPGSDMDKLLHANVMMNKYKLPALRAQIEELTKELTIQKQLNDIAAIGVKGAITQVKALKAARSKVEDELKKLLQLVLDMPFVIDEATVPKAGVDMAPDRVIGTLHLSLAKRRRIAAALVSKIEPMDPAED